MRYKRVKRILEFWCLFVGIGAIYGSLNMLVDPTGKSLGMDGMLKYFSMLPFSDVLFQDYTFSGISLLIVNGITNITAYILLLKNKKIGVVLGMVFGITLMLWITIQFIILPMNILSTMYFIFGLLQFITGYMTYVFYTQNKFKFDIDDYKNIDKKSDTLVVYFSRMNYTKYVAYTIANKMHADVYEIKSKEKVDGTIGFWWCGRFGMLKKSMDIEDIDVDIEKYKKIIICSPIWVFDVCAPIRKFISLYSGKIKNVEYVLVHYTRGKYIGVANYMDDVLKIKRSKLTNVRMRLGKVKEWDEYYE
mgnify:CR=1 FL=1